MPPVQPPSPETGAAVCEALRRQVAKLGLSLGDEPDWRQAVFEESTDPYTQEVSKVAYWRGGSRYGKAIFFPDGRLFAEYQVLQPHPTQAEHYVECVQVWGWPERLSGDVVTARLP